MGSGVCIQLRTPDIWACIGILIFDVSTPVGPGRAGVSGPLWASTSIHSQLVTVTVGRGAVIGGVCLSYWYFDGFVCGMDFILH